MAGTLTLSSVNNNNAFGFSTYRYNITVDSSGNLSGNSIPDIKPSLLLSAKIVPGTSFAGCNFSLKDSDGIDTLSGNGSSVASTGGYIFPSGGVRVRDSLIPTISGAAASAQLVLEIVTTGDV